VITEKDLISYNCYNFLTLANYMFKFFNKAKKASKSKTKNKKADASLKKRSTSSQKSKISADQSMNLAAEKLESTIRNLNARGTANHQPTPADKRKLINQALAIQKTQSKLLDGLDDDTRRRLKTLAIEFMVFNKGK
tara:strand:+ start:1682 stop:2092 length:411 start_codon:yes stop_codon:yes gene_type:complete